jgi:hypothetical protein
MGTSSFKDREFVLEKFAQQDRSAYERASWFYCKVLSSVRQRLMNTDTSQSKSQYERHFRIWGLRKNLTGPEWAVIIRYVKKNSIRLEEVEVLFRGHEIPQKRVLQEIARRRSLNNALQDGTFTL